MVDVPELVAMDLCVNDERGYYTGQCVALKCDGVELEAPGYPFEGPRFAFLPDQRMRLSYWVYPIHRRSGWVGNVYWDQAVLALDDARRLVGRCVARGWEVTNWEDGCRVLPDGWP